MARKKKPDSEFQAVGLGKPTKVKKTEGSDQGSSNQPIVGEESAGGWFSGHGAIPVPFSPTDLVQTYEQSNCLRQMVDAYTVNVYGTGWSIEPAIDLDAEGADQEVSDAIYAERLDLWIAEGSVGDPPEEPTDDEVQDRMDSLRLQMKREMFMAEAFFKSCSVDQSFVSLCRITGTDKEVTGNGYWEVIRSVDGNLSRVSFMPSVQTRLCSTIKEPTVVTERRYVSPVQYEDVAVERKFRKFVMEVDGEVVFFKEFGDPRTMSRKTGKVFKDEKEMNRELSIDPKEPNDGPANEVLQFRVPSVRSPYGIPRWIGVLLEIVGSRASGEVNFDYFDGKAIPPVLIMMSGGKLSPASQKILEDFFSDRVKGRENFHRGVLLQGLPNLDSEGRPQDVKIQVEKMAGEMEKEALFQNYDANNTEKVGAAFRLPQLLRGVVRDVNKASAKATIQFAEEQVFGPERLEFDWTVNNRIVNALGLTLVKFRSNGVQTSDPSILTEMIQKMMTAGGLTINESRSLLGQVFKKRFPPIDQFWAGQPLELTKMGFVPGGEDDVFQGDEEDGQETPEKDPQEDDPKDKATDDTLQATIDNLKTVIAQMRSVGAVVLSREQNVVLKDVEGMDLDGSVTGE